MADMFTEGTIPILEQMISFTEMRDRVIADNIANASAPDYKAKDSSIDHFRTVLSSAVEQRKTEGLNYLPLVRNEEVRLGSPGMLRHDASNVSIDQEKMKLSSNAMLSDVMVQLLAREFAVLHTAISERVTR